MSKLLLQQEKYTYLVEKRSCQLTTQHEPHEDLSLDDHHQNQLADALKYVLQSTPAKKQNKNEI